MDTPPADTDVAVGTKVIFPQGDYVLNLPTGQTKGVRYHKGVVTNIRVQDGITVYDGEHIMKLADGKMNFRQYRELFTNLTLDQLRLAPNAIDAVMAFSQ